MPTVDAEIIGTVWKVEVETGQAVAAGEVLLIVESMKMEFPVEAPAAGTVTAIHRAEGQAVAEGDPLITLE